MSLKENLGMGTTEPTLAAVLKAKVELRKKLAALTVAEAKLRTGDTWPEYVAARKTEADAARYAFAPLEAALNSSRSNALRPLTQSHAAAVENYTNAIRGIAAAEREICLGEIEMIERRETISLLDEAAKSADADTAPTLATYVESERTKLQAQVASQATRRKSADALRANLPELQKAMASSLSALAV